MSLAALILLADLTLASAEPTACAWAPPVSEIRFPERGVVEVDGSGECPEPSRATAAPKAEWVVRADGPSGSGRFWWITVGVPGPAGEIERGVCLQSSTVGWRTLRAYARTPLPWQLDVDSDGRPELVIWASFPLSESPTAADYGLVGWVYRVEPGGGLVPDWGLSGRLAQELATAYGRPLESEDEALRGRRQRAAQRLASFPAAQCRGANDPP